MSQSAKNTNRRLKIALIVAVVISMVVFTGGWYYIFRLSNDSNRLNTEGSNYQRESNAISDLKLSLSRISDQKESVFRAIPKSKDVSAFLGNFEDLANSGGLTITNTNVGDLKTKSKIGSDFSQTVNKNEYYELPINYEMKGDYMDFTKFMADIDNQKRLMSVSNLVVTSNSSSKTDLGRIVVRFVLTTYVKK